MEELHLNPIEEKIKLENQFKAGANWFFWIAGLSLVNSAVLLAGSNWGFVIGLGITQFIDAIGLAIAEEVGIAGKIIAFIFDIVAAGIFVLFGAFARKKHSWAFIVGMILYALDGLLFLLVMDILSIGFHVFALFCILNGLKSLQKLEQLPVQQPLEISPDVISDAQTME
ncbi:MAG: hypothetical protein ACYSUK_09800 [Planctomycetota bacterium]|jgi:hypothetical protein